VCPTVPNVSMMSACRWWSHDGLSDVYIAESEAMSAAASNGAVASTTPHQLQLIGWYRLFIESVF